MNQNDYPQQPPYQNPPPGQPGPHPGGYDLPPEFQTDLAEGMPGYTGGYPPVDDEPGGPGCLMWALVILVGGFIAVAIVVMAGAAGWTEGQRVAEANLNATSAAFADRQLPAIETNVANLNAVQLATRVGFLATRTPGVPQVNDLRITETAVRANITATQVAVIDEQLTQIPQAVSAGDSAQVEQRLAFLVTQTPGVPEVPGFQATATQLALMPTIESTSDAPQVVETTPTPTPSPDAGPTASEGGFDLVALFEQARDDIAFGDLDSAVETLDLIIRLDPNFNRAAVDALMLDALTQLATPLYQVDLSGDPTNTQTLAQAVRLTDQAELYGDVSTLSYERDIASLYLNAIGALEAGNHSIAINRLNAIVQFQGRYKGVDLNRMLFNEYKAYGDAFFRFDQDYCRAANQYEAALALFQDAALTTQRDTARTLCQQGTQAIPQGTLAPGEQPVAPIGVPGT